MQHAPARYTPAAAVHPSLPPTVKRGAAIETATSDIVLRLKAPLQGCLFLTCYGQDAPGPQHGSSEVCEHYS